METWIQELLVQLQSPVVLMVLIIVLSFILEDLATFSSAYLISIGKLDFNLALLALFIGISVGDLGLYYLGYRLKTAQFKGIQKFKDFKHRMWPEKPSHSLVFLARFIPGMRLPIYTLSGYERYPLKIFLMIVVGASLIWTYVLLHFGQSVASYLEGSSFLVLIACLFCLFWFVEKIIVKNYILKKTGYFSFYEFWPPWFFYLPIIFLYAYLSLKYRSFSLPTRANPAFENGGLLNESKIETHKELDQRILDFFPWQKSYKKEELIEECDVEFPVYFKPDIGQRGNAVFKCENFNQLKNCINNMPEDSSYIIQKEVLYSKEIGLFFIKDPQTLKVTIPSVTIKEYPFVVGDGIKNIEQLMKVHPRLKHIKKLFNDLSPEELLIIPNKNEEHFIRKIGNHCKGALFKNGNNLISKKLEEKITWLLENQKGVYFGRFDLKYDNWEDFIDKNQFQFIELNGAGAEMTHIWDSKMSLLEAYRVLFVQWKKLFEIGDLACRKYKLKKPFGVSLLGEIIKYKILATRYLKKV